jgi:hypothetical protein
LGRNRCLFPKRSNRVCNCLEQIVFNKNGRIRIKFSTFTNQQFKKFSDISTALSKNIDKILSDHFFKEVIKNKNDLYISIFHNGIKTYSVSGIIFNYSIAISINPIALEPTGSGKLYDVIFPETIEYQVLKDELMIKDIIL